MADTTNKSSIEPDKSYVEANDLDVVPNTALDAPTIGEFWDPQTRFISLLIHWVYFAFPARTRLHTTVVALAATLPLVWSKLTRLINPTYFFARMTVHNDDNLFFMLFDYLHSKSSLATEHSRQAVMSSKGAYMLAYDQMASERNEVRFFPTGASQCLWFEGRLLLITFRLPIDAVFLGLFPTDIIIRTFGRDTAPIQRFLKHVIAEWTEKFSSNTLMYRAVGSAWVLSGARPKRRLDSVILEDCVREGIMKDLSWYWSPSTIKEYAARSQPHRRGYLFHGPPGTGKTSTVIAIAGSFNADIYMLSLNSITSDNILLELMETIPAHALVLIEDIDCLDIRRYSAYDTRPPSDYSSVSLSGVLNAIDGITSPTGHVVIMTTNRQTALDEALTRPGRIDRQFLFDNCNKKQLRQLFIAYYRDPDKTEPSLDVLENAVEFANKVPERLVSPAKAQMYFSGYSSASAAVAALDKENDGAWFLKPEPEPPSEKTPEKSSGANKDHSKLIEDSTKPADINFNDDSPFLQVDKIFAAATPDIAAANVEAPQDNCQNCTNNNINQSDIQTTPSTSQKSWWPFRMTTSQ